MVKELVVQLIVIGVVIFISALAKQIANLTKNNLLYKQIVIFAENAVKSILQQYPNFSWEEILIKTLVILENKFGSKYFTKEDFENIIRSIIEDLSLSQSEMLKVVDNSLMDSVIGAQEKYLANKITKTDRKSYASNYIMSSLKNLRVEVDKYPSLVDTISNRIDSTVYQLKDRNVLISQSNNLQVKEISNKLDIVSKENVDLKNQVEKLLLISKENDNLKSQITKVQNVFK